MATNKVSYQTNFTGIKYSNNPLAIDINSFSTSNNVYLNKYGTLISRPPISALAYPYQVYSHINPKPDHLKLVSTYSLSNGGIVYVIFNTDSKVYTLRYKSPLDVYSAVINSSIASTKDFALTAYKQYYIMFTINGTRALDTTNAANSWVALNNIVDVPVTSIQTGNERLTMPGNQLTSSYKSQYIVKADSDDTIYNLPVGEIAVVTFPNQTDITYSMMKADEYTRSRLLSKLNTPANSNTDALISMAGEKIAIAHDDRVDISLDYGDTFTTIPYPTPGGVDYKNTASISDDGLCFFYVHTNGVYRYEIGIDNWTLIEPTTTHAYSLADDEWLYTSLSIERELTGVDINSTTTGANYCQFINAEKFAFMLAHYRPATEDWISVLYIKGTNITNWFNQGLRSNTSLLNSIATQAGTPIDIIGSNLTIWSANPYLNKKLIKIVDNNTVVYYSKRASDASVGIILKAMPTHVYRNDPSSVYNTHIVNNYATVKVHTLSTVIDHELNGINTIVADQIEVLLSAKYWLPIKYTLNYIEETQSISADSWKVYTISFTVSQLAVTNDLDPLITTAINNSMILHTLDANKYLGYGKLLVTDNTNTLIEEYVLPLITTSNTKVIVSGPNFIVYDTMTNSWYTNISKQAVLTYTYISSAPFTQVPTAVYDDQHLWLAMNKTLWIGYLIDNKLSIPAINNNVFSKQITAICPISPTSKAIFFNDSVSLCDEVVLSDNTLAWQYHSLKFSVGVRQGDTVITTNDGKLTLFPTKYGLAALTYQLDIAATEQAITYLTDDIKSMWAEFYTASSTIKMLHHNTQLILANGTNKVLIFDFRTNGWYPLTFPAKVNISKIQPSLANHEILELQPADAPITSLTGLYQLKKEHDELYSLVPYKDLSTAIIPWSLTSQLLLLDAPNNYKNITQLIIDQVDSSTLSQSAYLTTLLFRQHGNLTKPAIELVYSIDTFAKIIKKVNWWKVLGIKWQLSSDDKSSYPTQLRLYNFSITYDISYEVK